MATGHTDGVPDVEMTGGNPERDDNFRRLWAELSEFKKICAELQEENSALQQEISQLRGLQDGGASDANNYQLPSKRLRSDAIGNDATTIVNSINHNTTINNAANYCNMQNDNSVASKNNQKKKIIQAVNTNISEINNKIKKVSNANSYIIKQNNKNAPVKISITNAGEVPVIKKVLSEAKISYHEYKWESEKKLGYIIKGLIGATESDLEYVKSELVSQGLPDQISLSIYKSGYMRANPEADLNTLIQLVLPPNTDTQLLKTIKYIDHVVVKFEPILKNTILQCKNCQRFGHSSGGCQHTHRCVKCGANHYKESCPRTNNKSVKLHCCNCEGEHTANNLKECAYAKNYLSAYTNRRTTRSSSRGSYSSIDSLSHTNSDSRLSGILRKQSSSSPTPAGLSSKTTYSGISNQLSSNYQGKNQIPNKSSVHFNNKMSYADSIKSNQHQGHEFDEIMHKIDFVIELVLKHEQILSKLTGNG